MPQGLVDGLPAHINQVTRIHHFDGKGDSPSVVNSRICSSVLLIVFHSRTGAAPPPAEIAGSGWVNPGLRDNAQR
jgi:hypothetical protein